MAPTQMAPFHTPLVIASWEPVAKILVANGIAKPISPKLYGLDMSKLTQVMLAKKKWKELKDSAGYDVSRSVLVSTTDLRRSNSGAMYLALTSHALQGDVVTDRATAQQVSLKLAELFKRQGYQENYVDGNFDDYVSIGIGKTPMAFIYENQIVKFALAKKGVANDMVLMVPQPTIVNKVVFVAMNERAKALGELLGNDADTEGTPLTIASVTSGATRTAGTASPRARRRLNLNHSRRMPCGEIQYSNRRHVKLRTSAERSMALRFGRSWSTTGSLSGSGCHRRMTIWWTCFAHVVAGTVGSWRGGGGDCSSHSGCSIIMLACFGPEGGSDDKQQQGAERETAGGNLPAVGDDVLFRHLLFEFGNLRAVFRTEVRRWGW